MSQQLPSSLFEWSSSPPPCAQLQASPIPLSQLFRETIGSRDPSIIPESPSLETHVGPTEEDGVDTEMADDLADKGELRFNCKYFFLTYPKCTLHPNRIIMKFRSLRVDDFHLVREKHSDNSFHYHAIVAFATRKNIRNPRYFDVDGFHPNIQKIKSLIKSIRYLEKEKHGEIGEHVGGTLGPKIKAGKVGALDAEAKTAKWHEAGEEATSGNDFLNKLDGFDPRELAKSFKNIQAYADWKFKTESTYKYESPDLGEGRWNLPLSISDWVMSYITSPFEGT